METIHLLSDAGPHFRSYEALHHAAVAMPAQHKARVCIHFGVEKHFKSEADRLFAHFERLVKDARARQKDLIDVCALGCKTVLMHMSRLTPQRLLSKSSMIAPP